MGGSSPSSQTVTQVQQIPEYQQQFSQANQNLAQSLASTPYPVYQGDLIAPLNDLQNAGINQAEQQSFSYSPTVEAGINATAAGLNMSPTQWNSNTAANFMSPYISAALQPQIQQLNNQLALEQQGVGSQATQEGAFGDARQGAAEALNNFNANLSLNDLLGQGYNTAYTTGQQAWENQNQNTLAEQGQQFAGAANLGNFGSEIQSLGLTGANALYNAGQQQQTNTQQQLNEAYQQYMNQVNWPYQQLSVRESAISNNPYSMASYTQLPQANMTAQNLGSFASAAGALGSLLGNGGSSSSKGPFG